MLKTQLLFAYRAVIKNKPWFIINLIGFTIAFAITFLIFSWAGFELSYDNFYQNRYRIFRVLEKQNFKGQDEHFLAQVPEYLSNTFEKEIPEVEASSCLLRTDNMRIKLNNETVEIDNVLYADNKVFEIFTFGFIAGNSENALTEPQSAVLTKSTAIKLFNSEDLALGKTLELDNNKIYTVKGVIKDLPRNSHLQFNILISLEERRPGWNYKNGNHNASCYVLLKPNTDITSINPKLQTFVKRWLPKNADFVSFQLQPLRDIHLDSMFTIWEINWNKFDRKYVNAFIMVAFLILLIVISNYINLTLAYSTKRNVEVGLKKIVGSGRLTLIMQFFIETSSIIVLSLGVAFFIFENAIHFLQKSILRGYDFQYSGSSPQFIASIVFVVVIVELAGIYPSLIFTAFSPVSVLKNNITRRIKGNSLRRALTILQFVITIVLIISLFTIIKQVNYLKTKNLGYNKENVILLPADSYIKDHYDAVKADLLNNPSITDVTFSNTQLSGSTWRNAIDFEGRPPETRWEMPYMTVDYNYFDFYKMKIVKGRNFSPDLTPDKQGTAFIINESLARKLGFDDPIGKKFRNGGTQWGEIIGVVSDFNYTSLHDAIEPILFYPSRNYLLGISVKISGSNIPETMKFLETKWAVYSPGHLFRYSFLDKTIEQLYTKEEDSGRLIILFACISIFLSVIGLYGMASFLVKRRTKEIGIRKINGANVSEILVMLNTEFMLWVAIAFLTACPVGWLIMHKWLQNFAYRTDISWWIFALAGLITLVIALITVNWQSLQAAKKNPVEALHYE
jgi:putative ABC transport system permease protein